MNDDNDEHRPHQSGGDVFPPSGAQRLEARPTVVRRKRDTDNVAEFAIKIRYPTLGMIHGADDVAQSTQALGQKP